jgi:sugar phosphate isomerase/epimerase
MAKTQPQLAVLAAVFGAEPREAIRAARAAGFAGLQLDWRSEQLDVTTLSSSGRRELRTLLRSHDLGLVGLRIDLGGKGLGPGADVDAVLSRLDTVLQAAVGLGAPLVCLDVGPLPSAANKNPDPNVDRALGDLGILADRYSVAVAFRSELAGFDAVHRALAAADCAWFGVDLDPVAALRDDWPMDEIFTRLGPMIRHVRGRDAIAGADRRTKPAAIRRGSVQWDQLLRRLTDADYRGWITVDSMELPDPASMAIAGAASLRSLVAS